MTKVLVRDEFVGFAKSMVMLVLWIVIPVVSIAAFMLLPAEIAGGGLDGRTKLSTVEFMTLFMASISGLIAGVIPAADIVNEKNRNVYVLFAVRPFSRSALLWAMFIAVCGCILITCVVGITLAIVVDAARGHAITSEMFDAILRAMVSMIEVIIMSTALGVLFGVMARTVLVSVILFIFVGRNLLVVPMLPVYMRVWADGFWPIMAISTALTIALMLLAGRMFNKAQL